MVFSTLALVSTAWLTVSQIFLRGGGFSWQDVQDDGGGAFASGTLYELLLDISSAEDPQKEPEQGIGSGRDREACWRSIRHIGGLDNEMVDLNRVRNRYGKRGDDGILTGRDG